MKTSELFAHASPEIKTIVRSILELDIEMMDSMTAQAAEAMGGAPGTRTPGDPEVATIARDFQRSIRNIQYKYRNNLKWLQDKYRKDLDEREEQRDEW